MYNRTLTTSEDNSVNFIADLEDGAIEARFVQRQEDTVIVYLSSMTGCNLACRFCHLTQTGQTTMRPVTVDEYSSQAQDVLSHAYKKGYLKKASIVHFNFMARGDALSNDIFLDNTVGILKNLDDIATDYNLTSKFKISSIFPQSLVEKFPDWKWYDWINGVKVLPYDIEFYYSLYALTDNFRRRWLPKTAHPSFVGSAFANTREFLRIHHALIDGQNTDTIHIRSIQAWLAGYRIRARVNIVRYNSFGENTGTELSENKIHEYMSLMKNSPYVVDVHLISKVSTETKAACGMFVS